jgi:hypothetical protein
VLTLSSLVRPAETHDKTKVINEGIVGEVQNWQGMPAEAGPTACQTSATWLDMTAAAQSPSSYMFFSLLVTATQVPVCSQADTAQSLEALQPQAVTSSVEAFTGCKVQWVRDVPAGHQNRCVRRGSTQSLLEHLDLSLFQKRVCGAADALDFPCKISARQAQKLVRPGLLRQPRCSCLLAQITVTTELSTYRCRKLQKLMGRSCYVFRRFQQAYRHRCINKGVLRARSGLQLLSNTDQPAPVELPGGIPATR